MTVNSYSWHTADTADKLQKLQQTQDEALEHLGIILKELTFNKITSVRRLQSWDYKWLHQCLPRLELDTTNYWAVKQWQSKVWNVYKNLQPASTCSTASPPLVIISYLSNSIWWCHPISTALHCHPFLFIHPWLPQQDYPLHHQNHYLIMFVTFMFNALTEACNSYFTI